MFYMQHNPDAHVLYAPLRIDMLTPSVQGPQVYSMTPLHESSQKDVCSSPLLLPVLPPSIKRDGQAPTHQVGNDFAAHLLHMPLLSCMVLQEVQPELQHTDPPAEQHSCDYCTKSFVILVVMKPGAEDLHSRRVRPSHEDRANPDAD